MSTVTKCLLLGLALVACLAVFIWQFQFSKSPDVQLNLSSQIVDSECWFQIPQPISVRCGYYWTGNSTKKHNSAESIRFKLPFVILKDKSDDHQSDPLVYLPGGPGSSNLLDKDNINQWFDWAESANLSRDIVLLDQRGTGLSEPQYRCDHYENYLRDVLKKNMNQERELEALNKTLANCISEYQQQGFTLSDISTRKSVEDLNDLMSLLNYSTWNVMGASYGTRVALTWANEKPLGLRAMVLDSVYPPGKGGLLYWPETLDKSFRQAWAVCEGSDSCDFNEDQLTQALEYLKANPQKISVALWEGGWPINVVVNDYRFLYLAYGSLYRASNLQKLSNAIQGLLMGDNEVLQQLAEASINSDLDPDFNPFTFFLVDCAENYRPSQVEYDSQQDQFPLFARYTDQNVETDVCALFSKSKLNTLADVSQTPILFLSGGLDPVTPPRWIEEIEDLYPLGQTWLMPKLSHGVSANSDCVIKSLRYFLDHSDETKENPCLEIGDAQ